MRLVFIFSSILMIFSNCKTNNELPLDYDGPSITFGKGGGFSGQVKEYQLLPDGRIFKMTPHDDQAMLIDRIDKNSTTQIFNSYYDLGIDNLEINDPGNMYSFLIMKKDNKEHKIQWGGTQSDPGDALKIYFSNLMNKAKIGNTKIQKEIPLELK